MEIRKVQKDDLNKGLVDVFIEGYRYHCDGRPDIFSHKSDDNLKEDLVKAIVNDSILVLEDEDKIVGYIDYEIREKHAKTIWVDQLVISEKCRGKGYGKKLMEEIARIAKEEGCERIELECWSFNDSALGMYKHLGFDEQRVKLETKVK